MASVTFQNIVKKYGDVTAVNNLNIHVADKEFLVLVGPSGCGKTTALRSLAGLEEITSGEILIGDRVVNDVAPKDRRGYQALSRLLAQEGKPADAIQVLRNGLQLTPHLKIASRRAWNTTNVACSCACLRRLSITRAN